MPRPRRRYDEEFKRRAVELYLHSNNSLKQVARELGISDGSLRKWRKDLFGDSAGRKGPSHPARLVVSSGRNGPVRPRHTRLQDGRELGLRFGSFSPSPDPFSMLFRNYASNCPGRDSPNYACAKDFAMVIIIP